MKGYTAIGMLAGGAARLGRADRAGLAEALRGLRLHAGAPAMLFDAGWDAAGEMDRPTYMVEIRDGKPVVLRTLGTSR
jgi:branched-chain amino acid transport system substrate-binding protein